MGAISDDSIDNFLRPVYVYTALSLIHRRFGLRTLLSTWQNKPSSSRIGRCSLRVVLQEEEARLYTCASSSAGDKYRCQSTENAKWAKGETVDEPELHVNTFASCEVRCYDTARFEPIRKTIECIYDKETTAAEFEYEPLVTLPTPSGTS